MSTYSVWIIKSRFYSVLYFFGVEEKICVEYRKYNYCVGRGQLKEMHAETEHRCMIKCVRHHPCMAFNYHAINKTCVLLPEVECIPPSPDNGSGYVYVFVHLTACNFQSVYTSVRPADRNWYWSISDNPSDNTDVILLPGTTTRYVGTITTFQAGGAPMVRDFMPSTLSPHKPWPALMESSWLSLTPLYTGGTPM